VEAIRFHNDEKRLASGCAAGVVKIWDVEETKSEFLRVSFENVLKAETL